MFLAQPIPDLIFEVFSILKQKFQLKSSATIYAYNVEQLCKVLTEELEHSWTLVLLRKLLSQMPPDGELNIGDVVKMGVKYPLMFYFLKRFRQHVRRIFLGDKFWGECKALKTKLPELGIKRGYEASFQSEKAAMITTCRAILADCYGQPIAGTTLTADQFPAIKTIDSSLCNHLKKSVGYKLARRLIIESELPVDTNIDSRSQAFLTGEMELGEQDSRFSDALSGEALKYNNGTGRRAWVCRYTHFDDDDQVCKEIDVDVRPVVEDDWGGDSDDEEYSD